MRFFHFFQLLICFSHLWGSLLCLNTIHGHNYSLECLNDYLYTIRCELNMTSEPRPQDALYWLEFYDEREPFKCMLTSQRYSWVCVLNLSTRVKYTFMDMDLFQISLNYSDHGDNGSEVLEKSYMPVNYIRPVPPSNLTLLWKPDQAVFYWSSGYDESVMLVPSLKYQLSILANGKVWDIQSSVTSVSVPMSTFVPNTTYESHVRSAPNMQHYRGVWSHWSPTVYWTTEPAIKIKKSSGPGDVPDMSFATVSLALFLVPAILLCYFLYTRGKRCVLNPSPAPHIGDFKCSVMLQENASELLQREESLQIDSLTEEVDSAPQPNPTQRVNDGSGHASSSPSVLHLSVGSKVVVSSWIQALTSAEKGSVTYSDDYCTLSQTPSEHAVNTHEI